jgi:hypothetical protein
MTDPTQAEVPAGMLPWHGGDSAPDEWDGGPVLGRSCGMMKAEDFYRWYWLNNGADIIAYTPTPSTSVQGAGEAGGQDRKFAFRDGQYVNRVSGEPIPHDEPIIIFRARDHHALPLLREYLSMATDAKHQRAIKDRMAEFGAYACAHPERMKEPGITGDIRLNDSPLAPASVADEANAEIERLRGLLIDPGDPAWEDARAVLAIELRKAEMPNHARAVENGEGPYIPSWIALNLIAHARIAFAPRPAGEVLAIIDARIAEHPEPRSDEEQQYVWGLEFARAALATEGTPS